MLDKMGDLACERDLTFLNRVLVITLHLACLLTRETGEKGSEEYNALHKELYELVRINAKGKQVSDNNYPVIIGRVKTTVDIYASDSRYYFQGRDALQLVHSEDGALVGRYPTCKFPSPHLTKALLRVGANVAARDNDGNTALHLTAMLRPWRPILSVDLLDAGAHLDAVNNDGKTFQMLLCNKELYDSICPLKYTTLACLAARVVRKTQKITSVPAHLRVFVGMH